MGKVGLIHALIAMKKCFQRRLVCGILRVQRSMVMLGVDCAGGFVPITALTWTAEVDSGVQRCSLRKHICVRKGG